MCAIRLRADSAPQRSTTPLNAWRSSPSWIASTLAPISSHAVLLEDPALVQRDRDVERGLPAEGRQHRVRPLLGDDRLDHLGRDRLDVGRVGELGVGHDRRRVGVDQDDPEALLAQHPAGLRAGVVELAGLADDDRAGADDQDAARCRCAGASGAPSPASVGRVGHQLDEPVEQVAGVVRAGRGLRVVLHAERRQRPGTRRPSTTSSLRQTCETRPARTSCRARRRWRVTVERGVDGEAVVVRGRPRPCRSCGPCTGWLMPRWP